MNAVIELTKKAIAKGFVSKLDGRQNNVKEAIKELGSKEAVYSYLYEVMSKRRARSANKIINDNLQNVAYYRHLKSTFGKGAGTHSKRYVKTACGVLLCSVLYGAKDYNATYVDIDWNKAEKINKYLNA